MLKENVELTSNEKNKTIKAVRTIEEDLTPEQFVMIHKQLEDGVKAKKQELEDLGPIFEKKKADLTTEVKELTKRLSDFEKHLKQATLWANINKKENERNPAVKEAIGGKWRNLNLKMEA